MTVTNRELVTSSLTSAAVIVAALVAWGAVPVLSQSNLGIRIGHLVWPVIFSAVVAFLVQAWLWLCSPPRASFWPSLPNELRPEAAAYLLKVRRFFRDAAWSLLIVGVLMVWAGTRDTAVVYHNCIVMAGIFLSILASRPTAIVPCALWIALLLGGLTGLIQNLSEPRLYYSLLGGAGLVLATMASVDLVNLRFPKVAWIFGFPRYRLLVLALIAMLSYQGWSEQYGFLKSPLMPGLAAAAGASYLANVLRKVANSTPRGSRTSRSLGPAADLCMAASCGLAAWALLSALPNTSAFLLGEWPEHQLGHASLAHFSHAFDARNLTAAFCAAMVYAVRLPKTVDGGVALRYVLLTKAASYGLAGGLAWLSTAKLAPLGHGYPLLGTTIGCGLFAVALALLLGCFTSGWRGLAKVTADWLSQSPSRAFWMGASLVWYGLLVRPLIYDMLSFAPIYEWMAVLSFAVVAFYRMRQAVRAELLPESSAPPLWNNWSRHTPDTQEHGDTRLDALLAPLQHYVDTGEWNYVWRYVLALLLRNQVPLEDISEVFEPMRSCHLATSRRRALRKPKQQLLERWRRQALAEAMARAERALALPKLPLEMVDESSLLRTARPFLDVGDNPNNIAVLLAAVYWQKGASIDDAAALWFPLITMDNRDAPPFEAMSRKIIDRLSRRRGSRRAHWNLARRQRMVSGAVAHLFGEGSYQGLAVALANSEISVSLGDSWMYRRHRIPQRRAVEIIPGDGSGYLIRSGENPNNYIVLPRFERRPILPGDRSSGNTTLRKQHESDRR